MAVGMPQGKKKCLLVDGTVLSHRSGSSLLGITCQLCGSQSPRNLVLQVGHQELGTKFLLFGNREIAAHLEHLTLDSRVVPVAIRFLTNIRCFDSPVSQFLGNAQAVARKSKIAHEVICGNSIFIHLSLAK